MNVFVVIENMGYDGQDVIGVFSSLKAAQTISQKHVNRFGGDTVLEEFEEGELYGSNGYGRLKRLISKGQSRDYEILEYEVIDQ